ncbi:hypothetical protein K469DRAFT_302439 [Zopfia rhizophila CBS 207.26]|uniref:Uncharacterized protein n=1 Tax=Zopfia rhizophila CBS 207.26 TaxID=1314779 RepID=A0A6A6DIN4_9PEZI|nr:hypothetical protein K469DRAFT_302439 [Zopfia rhizophila CBS 207.26]
MQSWLQSVLDASYILPFRGVSNSTQTKDSIASSLIGTLHYESVSYSEQINALTNEITVAILSQYENHTEVEGAARDMVAFLEVKWAWLTRPLLTTFLAVVYLLSSAYLTWAHGAMVWKSPEVALLTHPLERLERYEVKLERKGMK